MGRSVIKGEQGIPILAPVLVKIENEDGEEEEKLIGFKVVHVFDFSQTEGKPLTEPPNWKSSEQNALLNQRLTQFAKDKGIHVRIEKLPGDTQGVSSGGTILISHTAGTKTLIHEIAHEIMHQGQEQPVDKAIRELEAEALGFDMTNKLGSRTKEYLRERDELVNRWFSGNRLPDDEERMFEEFYEGTLTILCGTEW
jgi:hypothetical protein